MCPVDHEACKLDDAVWARLERHKLWYLGTAEVLALANCPCCKSTLAREATASDYAREDKEAA